MGDSDGSKDHRCQRRESVSTGRLSCGPETLQVNLGHRCNLNCIFCWNHSPLTPSRSKGWHAQSLNEAHTRQIVEAIPKLQPDQIMFSGQGEPLIQPAAPLLLRAARDAGIPVIIQTNGVGGIGIEHLDGVERLMVNMSAATPAGYEATHPGRGDRLQNVLRRLKQAAEQKRRGLGPAVTILGIIQRTNIDEILPLVELAAKVEATAVHFKGMEVVPGIESLVLDPVDRQRVREHLERARIRALQVGVMVHTTHLDQVMGSFDGRRFTVSESRSPCVMGWYYLRVTCDGRVMFCCKDKLVGHLDERSLDRIWRSPTYHWHRLAARDADGSTGILDEKCCVCSNFERNRQVVEELWGDGRATKGKVRNP